MIASSRLVLARTVRYHGGGEGVRPIDVPVEAPVNLIYGGMPHVVLMASPSDMDDLALGFTLTEGIARSAADIRGIEVREDGQGTLIEIDLMPAAMKRFLARRRNMSGRTSCGLCGIESLDQLSAAAPVTGEAVSRLAIARALRELEASQLLHRVTRAVHAAAWCDRDGGLVILREDVGRHNALDKLIGACLRAGHDPGAGFVVITSRCSFEMVEKAASFGVATLVAISAPTSLAIERAQALGVHLMAVARPDSALSFTEAARCEYLSR